MGMFKMEIDKDFSQALGTCVVELCSKFLQFLDAISPSLLLTWIWRVDLARRGCSL